MHETNTFTHLRTALKAFITAKGEEVYGVQQWQGTVIDGIIDTLKKNGVDLIPGFFARTLPSGIVERSVYDYIKTAILTGIKDAGSLDGICLALHGSMYVEGLDDPEGDLLFELRQLVGSDIPIVCSLDMHATVTKKMIASADGFSAYRTAPHIDEFQTGVRAAKMLLASVQNHRKLVTCMKKIPVLIAGEQTETDTNPTKELFDLLPLEDKKEGIMCTSYVLGFPWADSVHNGVAALATGFAEYSSQLDVSAKRLAYAFDSKKTQFHFSTEAHMPEEAIDIALKNPTRPVVISDSGDNPDAGASQDTAIMVRLLIEKKVSNALVAAISDSKSYEKCRSKGVDAQVELSLGRLDTGSRLPTPLKMSAKVRNIARAGYMEYAVVSHAGIDIVISEGRVEISNPDYMKALGLDLTQYKIIVVKSGYLSPGYKALANRCILALTPGDTCEILDTLPYRVTGRPIFPLDK